MQKSQKKQHAFTLLELLIVMIILALLSGLGLMAFGTIQQKSRDSRRKQDLANISKALDVYYNDYGVYPDSNAGLILGCGNKGSEACNWGDPWQDDNDTLYMSALPQDPASNQNYFYDQLSANSYYLFASLENELDGDASVDEAGAPSSYRGYFCDDATLGCNYLVKSTNIMTDPAVITLPEASPSTSHPTVTKPPTPTPTKTPTVTPVSPATTIIIRPTGYPLPPTATPAKE
ncbi:MAG: type II secretion system protein [Candidatus Pacebacteria bacterium]|nr:type II secretion system protein [Candidatus Paceibacterota bacterium]